VKRTERGLFIPERGFVYSITVNSISSLSLFHPV
jgi:hypothetical protein